MLNTTNEAFFIDRSFCVPRVFTVLFSLEFRNMFTFCVLSPFLFTPQSQNSVLRSHVVNCADVQRFSSARSAFAHGSSGEIKRFSDCSYIFKGL